MKSVEMAEVLSMGYMIGNICDLKIHCPKIAQEAKPGQFVEVYPDNGVNLLARPISICEIDKVVGSLRLVFQVVGKGTELFSHLTKGDRLRILGPCGNGYDIKKGKALLVGGGIGVPPLLEACKNIEGEKIVVLGFRSGCFLAEEFEKYNAKVYIATDDGSVGFKGNVVDLLKSEDLSADVIYSCGPKIMLKFLSAWAEEKKIECQVSMEERMACGIGACVGCVVKIKEGDSWTHKKVCKDGPVFNSKEVIW
ncbi:MAG: dihydroorotate dehydrogenase electron transfer subunit [Lachnospirales bacterium]